MNKLTKLQCELTEKVNQMLDELKATYGRSSRIVQDAIALLYRRVQNSKQGRFHAEVEPDGRYVIMDFLQYDSCRPHDNVPRDLKPL